MSSRRVLVRGESVVRLHRRWIFHHQVISTNTNRCAETHTETVEEDMEDSATDAVVDVVVEAMGNNNRISHPLA